MLPALESDLSQIYTDWLKSRITSAKQASRVELSTPFLDVFNDGLRIYMEKEGAGFLLHDDGVTLENLACLGVDLSRAERRQRVINNVLAGSAVRLHEGRLQTQANQGNLPQRAHYLISTMLRVNDLWMSATPQTQVDFFDIVREYLDAHNVVYGQHISIPGKTVEHPVDFMINFPRGRERLVKLIGTPKPDTAKLVSFTWMDISEVRPNAEKVVVLKDTLSTKADPQAEEEERKVSDQTLAILSGYCDRVFRWSEREESSFNELWAA